MAYVRYVFILFFLLTPPIASATPARVTTLAAPVQGLGPGSATVTWLTPAPQAGCTLMANDIRISTVPITALNFATRTPVPGVPIPTTAGAQQTALITGLGPNGTYYVALKVRDNCGAGWSLMSNLVTITALPPTMTMTLTWSEPGSNGLPPDTPNQLIGYRVYWGSQPGTGDRSTWQYSQDVGLTTTHILTGLPYGVPTYAAASAVYNSAPYPTPACHPPSGGMIESCLSNYVVKVQ